MEVFVTPKAEKDFEKIAEFIRKRWGANAVSKFVAKVDELLVLLKYYPLMGQAEFGDIRGVQLTPQTRILYRVRGAKVIVLKFFDVRQSPKKRHR